jgi:hypothetical protein
VCYFAAFFNVYTSLFLFVTGAPEYTTFQQAVSLLVVPCCVALTRRSVANSNTVAIDGRAPCRQDQGNGFTGSHGSPANLPPAKGEGQDDANEWSTEFSVLATSAGCFLSIAAAVAVWVVVVCHVPVHRRWLPLGLFCLPLAIRWAALFGGGAPFVTTAHAQLVMMVGEISLSLTRLMLLPAWAG